MKHIERLWAEMKSKEIEAILVSSEINQFYLGNFAYTDGYVFVLGDNRNHSLDSRSDAIGFVHYRNIVGRMLFRFLPYEKFGPVAMP